MAEEKKTKLAANIIELINSEVLDRKNKTIKLGHFWKEQTCVFVFIRHFACVGCRNHAIEVWKNKELYEKDGAKIYFIGNGQPYFINDFCKTLDIEPDRVFTDPQLKAFKAAGFKRGFLAAMGPKSVSYLAREAIKGNKAPIKMQKGVGDLWQLGGVLVVDKTGKVKYQFVSEAQGDFPPEKDVIS